MSSVCFITLMGIPWAVTQWAPYAIISTVVSMESEQTTASPQSCLLASSSETGSHALDLPVPNDDDDDDFEQQNKALALGSYSSLTGSRAGIIMGIHNIAIALPQIISAIVSAVVFALCQLWRIDETTAILWVLRVSLFSSLAAAYLARKIGR